MDLTAPLPAAFGCMERFASRRDSLRQNHDGTGKVKKLLHRGLRSHLLGWAARMVRGTRGPAEKKEGRMGVAAAVAVILILAIAGLCIFYVYDRSRGGGA